MKAARTARGRCDSSVDGSGGDPGTRATSTTTVAQGAAAAAEAEAEAVAALATTTTAAAAAFEAAGGAENKTSVGTAAPTAATQHADGSRRRTTARSRSREKAERPSQAASSAVPDHRLPSRGKGRHASGSIVFSGAATATTAAEIITTRSDDEGGSRARRLAVAMPPSTASVPTSADASLAANAAELARKEKAWIR